VENWLRAEREWSNSPYITFKKARSQEDEVTPNLKASRQEAPTESLRRKAGAEDERVREMQMPRFARGGKPPAGCRATEEVVRGAGAVESQE